MTDKDAHDLHELKQKFDALVDTEPSDDPTYFDRLQELTNKAEALTARIAARDAA
jgi:hypothetical protein